MATGNVGAEGAAGEGRHRKRIDAGEWARRFEEERTRRQEGITARRLAAGAQRQAPRSRSQRLAAPVLVLPPTV